MYLLLVLYEVVALARAISGKVLAILATSGNLSSWRQLKQLRPLRYLLNGDVV